jgi:hypothetical protein
VTLSGPPTPSASSGATLTIGEHYRAAVLVEEA